MDRRNFIQTLLAAPLLTQYIQASQSNARQQEFYLISDHPEAWLDLLLREAAAQNSSGDFAFLTPHPRAENLTQHLIQSGWKPVGKPAQARLCISGSRLQSPVSPSFTMVENGRVRDIRTHRLYPVWKTFQNQPPSRQLTTISFMPQNAGSGKSAVVYHHGRRMAILPLNQRLTTSFPVGSGRIIVKVNHGKAWVEDSPCSQKICRHAAPICLAGERIICAPNRFLLEIEGRGGVDTVLG
jgi:hypothetical protein